MSEYTVPSSDASGQLPDISHLKVERAGYYPEELPLGSRLFTSAREKQISGMSVVYATDSTGHNIMLARVIPIDNKRRHIEVNPIYWTDTTKALLGEHLGNPITNEDQVVFYHEEPIQ